MPRQQKPLRPRCYHVLDWILRDTEPGDIDHRAAKTVREHGLTSSSQERVLAEACEASGFREYCAYADDCGIGEIEWAPPSLPGHTSADVTECDVGKGHLSLKG